MYRNRKKSSYELNIIVWGCLYEEKIKNHDIHVARCLFNPSSILFIILFQI